MNCEHCWALHHLLLLDKLMSKRFMKSAASSMGDVLQSCRLRFHSGLGIPTSTLWAYATILKSTLTLG